MRRRSVTSTMITAGWVCLFLAAVHADSAIEPLYKKVGDEVTLLSGSASGPITSGMWKDGPNIAVQWDGTDIDYYRHFKERSRLNASTGHLTLTGLTPGDGKVYTPEINNNLASPTRLIVIFPVPAPTVTMTCEEGTGCLLTCEGNVTGAEPATYKWISDVTMPTEVSKELRITKEDSLGVREFSCELGNPVSQERSQPITNPFYTLPDVPTDGPTVVSTDGPPPDNVKISAGLTVFLSLLAIVVMLVIIHRWKSGSWFFQKDSMPWEAAFWSRDEGAPREAAESNGTTSRLEKQQTEEETPMT